MYNYDGGPCYRCIFPSPPPPEAVTNCSEGGVLGAGQYLVNTYIYSIFQGIGAVATGMVSKVLALPVFS